MAMLCSLVSICSLWERGGGEGLIWTGASRFDRPSRASVAGASAHGTVGSASHSSAAKAAPTAPSPPGLGEMRSDSASRPSLREGPHQTLVRRAAADQRQGGHDLPAADHRGHEIPRHREAQTVGDLADGRPFLLQVDHVRLGEYAAPAGDGCPPRSAGRQPGEGLHVEAQPRGLLLEEGARSGRALLVQAIVQQRARPRFDDHIAGRMAADLNSSNSRQCCRAFLVMVLFILAWLGCAYCSGGRRRIPGCTN